MRQKQGPAAALRRRAGAVRVALVHDWLVSQRGGENVLLELCRLFPEAPIFTLVHWPGQVHPEIESHPIVTSFIQKLPGARRGFRRYLPLFPRAVEAWDLARFDVVLSTSHCVAKGVLTAPHQHHVAYVHTPMRYLWDQLPQYVPFGWLGRLLLPAVRLATQPLRRWDVDSGLRANMLVANSRYVAQRIKEAWGREAAVLYPPVDVDFFAAAVAAASARHGFLVVNALVPYKRTELAVRVATRRGLPLTVVGEGPEGPRLRRMAGPTVTFAKNLSREQLRTLYAGARALIHGGVEDFGIVPVEAMAAGCPVIALREGGLTETVVEEPAQQATGVFFEAPQEASLARAVERFEQLEQQGCFAPAVLQQRAVQFGRARFAAGLQSLLEAACGDLGREALASGRAPGL